MVLPVTYVRLEMNVLMVQQSIKTVYLELTGICTLALCMRIAARVIVYCYQHYVEILRGVNFDFLYETTRIQLHGTGFTSHGNLEESHGNKNWHSRPGIK